MVIDDSAILGIVTPLSVAAVLWFARRAAAGQRAELVRTVRADIGADTSTALEAVGAEQTRQHSEMRTLVGRNHAEVTERLSRLETRTAQVERDLGQTRTDVAYLRGRQERSPDVDS